MSESGSGSPGPGAEPRLYRDLSWLWPMLSPPGDYASEAGVLLGELVAHFGGMVRADGSPLRVLEFGAGGGHTLCHLVSAGLSCTACDRSEAMLAQCRRLIPGIRTVVGDMRNVTVTQAAVEAHEGAGDPSGPGMFTEAGLGAVSGAALGVLPGAFDAVLIHDAVDYLLTAEDLRATLANVQRHLAPGGIAMIAPTYTAESFTPGAIEADSPGRDVAGMPDPAEAGDGLSVWGGAAAGLSAFAYTSYVSAAYEGPGGGRRFEMVLCYHLERSGADVGGGSGVEVEVIVDRHVCGLFAAADWRRMLDEAGFEAKDASTVVSMGSSSGDSASAEKEWPVLEDERSDAVPFHLFIAHRRGDGAR